MEIKEAIAILEVKKLAHCSQKEYVEALDMAICALREKDDSRLSFRQVSPGDF